VKEVPVRWEEQEGSHLNVIEATLQMLRDMFMISVSTVARYGRLMI